MREGVWAPGNLEKLLDDKSVAFKMVLSGACLQKSLMGQRTEREKVGKVGGFCPPICSPVPPHMVSAESVIMKEGLKERHTQSDAWPLPL